MFSVNQNQNLQQKNPTQPKQPLTNKTNNKRNANQNKQTKPQHNQNKQNKAIKFTSLHVENISRMKCCSCRHVQAQVQDATSCLQLQL